MSPPKKSLIKIIKTKTTEEDVIRFMECVTYRYLSRILEKVVNIYNISKENAEILHDRFVNMNLIEVRVEEEEEDEKEDEEEDQKEA